MKFSKDSLRWQEHETVYDRIIGHGRWSVHRERVFKHDGRFYLTTYSHGATESQDESPYDYQPDEIECVEVVPRETVVVEYVELRKAADAVDPQVADTGKPTTRADSASPDSETSGQAQEQEQDR